MHKKHPHRPKRCPVTATNAATSLVNTLALTATGVMETNLGKIVTGTVGAVKTGKLLLETMPHPKIIIQAFTMLDKPGAQKNTPENSPAATDSPIDFNQNQSEIENKPTRLTRIFNRLRNNNTLG